jgi:CRISPR/Cas system-associated protein Cas5 (RAMP superfamily)
MIMAVLIGMVTYGTFHKKPKPKDSLKKAVIIFDGVMKNHTIEAIGEKEK